MRSEFIDPGVFRHELTLEKVALVPDGVGGHTQIWSEVGALFARIEPVSAKSSFGADQIRETVTHRVTMRGRNDIASGMRLRRITRILEILTVHDPDETGRYLVCQTKEIGK